MIEEYVNVNDVPLKLIDTAGIRHTNDTVEKIGVERSRQAIDTADLILLLIDSSQSLTDEDQELIQQTANKPRIVILNKTDLPTKVDEQELAKLIDGDPVIKASMTKHEGINELSSAISHLFFDKGIESSQNNVMVTNARHIGLLRQADAALGDVLKGLDDGMPVDLVQIDMTHAWDLLGEITGDSYQDELLDQLFSQFCLGK